MTKKFAFMLFSFAHLFAMTNQLETNITNKIYLALDPIQETEKLFEQNISFYQQFLKLEKEKNYLKQYFSLPSIRPMMHCILLKYEAELEAHRLTVEEAIVVKYNELNERFGNIKIISEKLIKIRSLVKEMFLGSKKFRFK